MSYDAQPVGWVEAVLHNFAFEACGLGRPKPNITREICAKAYSNSWRWVSAALCVDILEAAWRPLPNLRFAMLSAVNDHSRTFALG
jgi:hypothetical protein